MKKSNKYFWSWFYFVFVLLVITSITWWLAVKKGVFYQEPKHSVTLFTTTELPFIEATPSAEFAGSPKELEEYISAKAFFVVDNTTKTVILEKNPQLPLPPASTTKLMTILSALKLYDLDEIVTVSTASALDHDGGGLFPLERIKVRDLAAAALVQSANDAAFALADNFYRENDEILGAGSFVKEMNKNAQALHLTSTRFENPVGYDHPDNISTARDLAVLTMRVFKEAPIAEWMGLRSYIAENETGSIRHFLFSTNVLLGREEGVIAGKTGTTPLAKEVLITISKIKNHEYIIVILGSDDRYNDTKILLHYVRDNIQWKEVEFPLQIIGKDL
ncbi:MAG: D-alanyl-D-alanine carboxypeptidase [Candidatus Pacebacteria bacterium]|nr:D-alanyl-D-alanine carboxypeptidase [Candidatus Paceibacterota bacterium]MBT4651929.1 D-alanyl-D-alanine carboxypeptidase [Candidatus Paceibacterota bacterium]MBT6755951.1 D-alanyl-D-alanine carboxypeptidase [Candidatus Paceibacterota bacterium]MBT6920856.1 D-alanyl-D-alanine carboxypeptidase [Candidatus Paceibacterota bacterium]